MIYKIAILPSQNSIFLEQSDISSSGTDYRVSACCKVPYEDPLNFDPMENDAAKYDGIGQLIRVSILLGRLPCIQTDKSINRQHE